MSLEWQDSNRLVTTEWSHGVIQIYKDNFSVKKPYKYTVFEVGAIIGQGRAASLAQAKRLSEACLPVVC